MAIEVKTYRNNQLYQKDANKMGKKGWKIVSVITENQKSGCLGFFAKAVQVIVVTYEKA